ncbi:MAG: ATP-dependent DNA helicase [Nanoarchaeota archaeon]|nr:ATP-dependent DNA helicase [Nanoarchaeota archaeon]MBU1632002.1 ATP-dependent DNA helicase [Nanoarchaeota archaeon]MBU1875617.1 ATP-dependent DNA helicase [Nanoarchaeota archaeon]
MDSYEEIELFPHDKIRPKQDELIKDIKETIENEKILLSHAPTGLGKTASALSVALSFALNKNKKVFFLTNRHTQHKIAIDTLKLIKEKKKINFSSVDLIGKKWMCNQDIANLFGNDFNEFCKAVVEKGECEFYNNVKNKKQLTVEAKRIIKELKLKGPLHNEEIVNFSKEEKMCSYEISLSLAKSSDVIIGDYYYLFSPFVQNTLFTKLDIEMEDVILIVDEGHNLPNRITDMLSVNLTSNIIKNALIEAKKFKYNGLIIWLQELMRILTGISNFSSNEYNKEKLVAKEELTSKLSEVVDYDEFINELEIASDEVRKKQRKSYLGSISNFLASWKGEDKGYSRIITEKNGRQGPVIILSYTCLDPRIITKDIFKRIHSGIIMSGTLKPTFMYKDLLGIERGVEKEYGSPFPIENKLSLIIPETSTKYNLRGEVMYKKIASKCSEISSIIPGNIAFFFPSYQLRDNIANYIQSNKKKFWEKGEMSKEEKENFLAEFRAEKDKGGILLGVAGANFAEGVDLPGDLLNGVVIVGLPLAHPNLKTKETIKYYEEKFGKGWDYGYIYPAMNKTFQSAGRCIRSETDKGAIIYLDERFVWQNYFCCFPKEGLCVIKEFDTLLKNFFRSC